jgi:hypothetical protein
VDKKEHFTKRGTVRNEKINTASELKKSEKGC